MVKRLFTKATKLLAFGLCISAIVVVLLTGLGILDNIVSLFFIVLFSAIGFFALLIFSIGLFIFGKKDSLIQFDIFNNLSESLIITDIEGKIIKANKISESFFKNLSGAPFLELQKWGVSSEVLYRLFNQALEGKIIREEVLLEKKLFGQGECNENGYSYILETNLINDGQYILWRIIDSSYEKKMQESYFRDLQEGIQHLDFSPAGFLSFDVNRKIIYINGTLASLTSQDLSNFISGEIEVSELFSSRDAVRVDDFLKTQQDGELLHLRLKEQGRPVDIFVRWQSNNKDDALCRAVIVPSAEITEQLANDVPVFNDYFKTNPIAMVMVDAKGDIVKENDFFNQLVSHKQEEQRLSLVSLVAPHDRERLTRIIENLCSKNFSVPTFETTLGETANHYVKFYFCPVFDFPGYGDVIFVSVVETTEMRVLEEQMVQTQKMQAVGQLAGGIAHDFNNVLTAIIMSCDLLLASHRSSDPSHPDLMNIKLNANRAASLVQQLLAFSRRQTLRPQIVDLPELLSGIMNMVLPALGTHIKTETAYARDLWPVEVDKSSLDQVVTNLVFNARDAMPNGGKLFISTRNITESESRTLLYQDLPIREYVAIEVKDTGTGIEPKIREKIFEPFFTTKEVGKGTGLGLSMVYGIIKQTNGYIYCDSTMGKGTTFLILLPRYVQSQQEALATLDKSLHEKIDTEVKSVDLSGSATVLMVEDEDAVRMGGVRALQSRGYTVLEASNGIEALEVLEAYDSKVDIVVSDVVMPEMDGPTLLRELRKTSPDIKFIFVSGYAKDAFAKNLPEDAEFGFLAKPFSLKDLASAVKNMLEE